MMSPTAFQTHGKDWCLNNPVGTGPFKLTSFTRDVQKTFERWDGYWQEGKPYLDKIVVDIIADPMTQIASFLKGDDDVIINLDPTDAFNLKDKPGVVISQSAVTGDELFLFPNSANTNSPWNKLEVRQAMSYAVDTQAIVDNIFKGFAESDKSAYSSWSLELQSGCSWLSVQSCQSQRTTVRSGVFQRI